ncbi:MAG: hypothetical protein B7Z43_11110 [Sphingomonas sp. 12-62-6]|nr:MAG: hypothetical protein B7Z43_11110 [Sphingomonas sp. 12-62-6]
MVNNVRSPKCARLWAAIAILIAPAGPLAEQSSRAWGAEPEAPAVEPPAQPNPLLRKLFQLFEPQPGMTPGDNEDGTKNAQPAKDSVDGRLPKDPQIDALWRAGKAAIEREQWQTALELLQKLLDLPEDAVIQERPGEWSSVRTSANRQIARLPATARADYAKQYGGLAQRLYEEALALWQRVISTHLPGPPPPPPWRPGIWISRSTVPQRGGIVNCSPVTGLGLMIRAGDFRLHSLPDEPELTASILS